MNSIRYSKAYWLVQNTTLSFEQIADYCSLHILEVQAIADGVSKMCVSGYDLVEMGEISKAEIARCEADHTAVLVPIEKPVKKTRKKKPI